MTLAVIDCGIGNVQSLVQACRRVDKDPLVISSGTALLDCQPTQIILPGVGAIGQVKKSLVERGLWPPLADMVSRQKIPLLGICVGMHLLAETCEEFGEHTGFGWIKGRVRRLAPAEDGFKVPHIGWNTVSAVRDCSIAAAVDGKDMYFIHSYAFFCQSDYIIAETDHGETFPSIVGRDHIYGVQFHPEKSAADGQAVLSAFFELSTC